MVFIVYVHSFTSYCFLRNISSIYDELALKGKILIRFYGSQEAVSTAKVIIKRSKLYIHFKYLLLKYSGILLTFLKNLALHNFNNQICLPLYLLICISNYSKYKTAEFLCNYLCFQQQELLSTRET